ncbi:restriction endonuclease subunit S [Nostoc sp. ChiSLP03a]|uniref:restriction endonuclease subunit S n=1 Tax=Nostoc sp. ChiSLP03a TaxID=3075380 RepID=UPI002AD59626|nr:restriction endonuclease subunit S [Nostoc sp. ChiSLP03a]MDZ8214934.1 restriction endonuclease subunit S [Nostoc sp. ChiSLP03a]
MLKLTFKQTSAEVIVRAASTIIFNTLNQLYYPSVALSKLAENPQYGFTASASIEEIGAKFVRITDLKDGGINWDTVPYCKCDEPEKYLIYPNDILFARTGATTGKTHLVKEAPYAVFASYLIRIRPKPLVEPEYLYSFFQSDAYWTQILDEKEGSAQPNVNGQKLMKILVPMVDSEIQSAISNFLEVVRKRQDGSFEELPELPPPLEQQRRIMMRVEELVGKIEEVRSLRQKALEESNLIYKNLARKIFDNYIESSISIEKLVGRTNLKNGKSIRATEQLSGIKCIRLSAIRDGQIDCTDSKPVPMSHEEAQQYLVKAEDVFIVRGNGSKHLVGQAGIVKKFAEGTIFPDLFILVPLDSHKILPSFFVAWWNNPLMREKITEVAKTTSGIWKINQGHIASFSIPVPPLSEQHRIVAYLDELQTKVDTMKQLREQAMKELDALIPSILDKAFKGEL